MQRHTLPREWQGHALAFVRYRRRVQGRIQQHRMHTESGYTPGSLRQRHFGEELVAATPQRGQSLERRAVLVAAGRQSLIAVGHIDGSRALRRP